MNKNQICYMDARLGIEKHQKYLPHWQQPGCLQFITWHLGDALPLRARKWLAREREKWMREHPRPWSTEVEAEYVARFASRVDRWLDAGYGSCCLRDRRAAGLVANALRYFNGVRYDLDCFVVMPNHVHVLVSIRAEYRLEKVVHSWKSFSAGQVNRLLDRSGTLWMADYWDRMIRDREHYERVRGYICRNPVKAGLRKGEFLLWRDSRKDGILPS